MAGTTGRQRIPNEVFDEIMIPLPPESEKMIIEKKIENAEKTVVSLLKKIEQAKCLKIAVFNALFAGGVE